MPCFLCLLLFLRIVTMEILLADFHGIVISFSGDVVLPVIDIVVMHFYGIFLVMTVCYIKEITTHSADSDQNCQDEYQDPEPERNR